MCDATVVPVVTGHVDWAALDQLTETFLLTHGIGRHTRPGRHRSNPAAGPARGRPGLPGSLASWRPSQQPDRRRLNLRGRAGAPAAAAPASPGGRPLSPATRDRLRRALLGLAADTLSGPDGLAARLRAALDGTPLTTASLPLDIGAATETIPAHLRRAVTTRHPHCAFPGCDQPAKRLRHPPHHPQIPRRPHQPAQPRPPVRLPPPDRDPPLGLETHPAPRRHHHRHQPGRHPHPAQPQPARALPPPGHDPPSQAA